MDGRLRADPVARLLMRYDEMESGGTVHAACGTHVAMDAAEIRVMRGKGGGDAGSAASAMRVCRAVRAGSMHGLELAVLICH